MAVQENKALAAQLMDEVMNKGNVALIDRLATQNFIDHASMPGMPAGRDGVKAFVTGFRAAFPDLHYTTDDVVAEGDKVVQRSTGRGTMRGDFMGMPASGKSASWQEIHITRFAEGKAVEHWAVVDQYSMLTQLGFVGQESKVGAGH
ncbi:MAG: ester cyclase [Candidatus Limnocylindrales bacterium]|jgi:steroid delta-isomerase-like uncharacterized protein